MNSKQCEVVGFSVDGAIFGVELRYVEEFIWLPYLTSLEEQPPYVLGSFELRGEIVKVVDINLRLGHPGKKLTTSNAVIVTRTAQGLIGLLGDELIDTAIVQLSQGQVSSVDTSRFRPLVLAQFQLHEQRGALIDPQELVAGDTFPFEYLIERKPLFPSFDAQSTATLKRRQADYSRDIFEQKTEQSNNLAIVEINDELFGIDVNWIQEFTRLDKLFPLPNTPAFLLGHINLRGELVTVFDITGLLNIDPVRIQQDSRLVIFSLDNQLLAFLVDELIDVVDVARSSLNEAPIAIPEDRRKLLLGECVYENRSVIVMNVERIFSSGQLIVDQE